MSVAAKRLTIAAFGVTVLVGLPAGAASAGEVKGPPGTSFNTVTPSTATLPCRAR